MDFRIRLELYFIQCEVDRWTGKKSKTYLRHPDRAEKSNIVRELECPHIEVCILSR